MGLESLINQNLPKEVGVLKKEEKIKDEQKEEREQCEKILKEIEPFLKDIETYNFEKISPLENLTQEERSLKEAEETEKKVAREKEKERIIDLPYLAEKITVGYLDEIVKKNKKGLLEALKQEFPGKKINIQIYFPDPYSDRIRGWDAVLAVIEEEFDETTNRPRAKEVLKEIPIQITTTIQEKVIKEKLKRINKDGGFLILLNKGAFKDLVNKYSSYLKEIPKDKVKPPWVFFEAYDVKEKDIILEEGKEIKNQFFNGLRFVFAKKV
jgi:hypothetical protein